MGIVDENKQKNEALILNELKDYNLDNCTKKITEYIKKPKLTNSEEKYVKALSEQVSVTAAGASVDNLVNTCETLNSNEIKNNYIKRDLLNESFFMDKLVEPTVKKIAAVRANPKKRGELFKKAFSEGPSIDKAIFRRKMIKNMPDRCKKKCQFYVKNGKVTDQKLDLLLDAYASAWYYGYDIDELIGSGALGFVFSLKDDKNHVIKCIENNAKAIEITSIKELRTYIDKLSPKERSHLNIPEIVELNVLKLPKGVGSVVSHMKEKIDAGKGVNKIDTIVRVLEQGAKGLQKLHRLGLSHNDVKPDNIIRIQKDADTVAKKMSELEKNGSNKKVHKHKYQLIDFGSVCKFDDFEEFVLSTKRYCAPDAYTKTKEAVEKRDSYSLGVSGVDLMVDLIGSNESYADNLIKSLPAATEEEFRDMSLLYASTFNGNSEEKLYKFFKVLAGLLQPSYSKRMSIEESVSALKDVKSTS